MPDKYQQAFDRVLGRINDEFSGRMASTQEDTAVIQSLSEEFGPEWIDGPDEWRTNVVNLKRKAYGLGPLPQSEVAQRYRRQTLGDMPIGEALTDIGGIRGTVQGLKRRSALSSLERGETLSQGQEAALMKAAETERRDASGSTLGAKVGYGAAVTAPFFAEMALTGGASAVGRTALRAGARKGLEAAGAKGLVSYLGRVGATKGADLALRNVPTKVAMGVAEAGAAGAARAAMLPTRALAGALEDSMPGVTFTRDEWDRVTAAVTDPEMTFASAFLKNFIQSSIEYGSEELGEGFAGLMDATVLKALPAGVKEKLSGGVLAYIAGKSPNKKKFLENVSNAVGLQGLPAEWLEEDAGQFAEFVVNTVGEATGVEGFKTGQAHPFIYGQPDAMEQIAVRAGVLAVPQLGRGVVGAAASPITRGLDRRDLLAQAQGRRAALRQELEGAEALAAQEEDARRRGWVRGFKQKQSGRDGLRGRVGLPGPAERLALPPGSPQLEESVGRPIPVGPGTGRGERVDLLTGQRLDEESRAGDALAGMIRGQALPYDPAEREATVSELMRGGLSRADAEAEFDSIVAADAGAPAGARPVSRRYVQSRMAQAGLDPREIAAAQAAAGPVWRDYLAEAGGDASSAALLFLEDQGSQEGEQAFEARQMPAPGLVPRFRNADLAGRTGGRTQALPRMEAPVPVQGAAVAPDADAEPTEEEAEAYVARLVAEQEKGPKGLKGRKEPQGQGTQGGLSINDAVAIKADVDRRHARLSEEARGDVEQFGADSPEAQASAAALDAFEREYAAWTGVGGARTIEARWQQRLDMGQPLRAPAGYGRGKDGAWTAEETLTPALSQGERGQETGEGAGPTLAEATRIGAMQAGVREVQTEEGPRYVVPMEGQPSTAEKAAAMKKKGFWRPDLGGMAFRGRKDAEAWAEDARYSDIWFQVGDQRYATKAEAVAAAESLPNSVVVNRVRQGGLWETVHRTKKTETGEEKRSADITEGEKKSLTQSRKGADGEGAKRQPDYTFPNPFGGSHLEYYSENPVPEPERPGQKVVEGSTRVFVAPGKKGTGYRVSVVEAEDGGRYTMVERARELRGSMTGATIRWERVRGNDRDDLDRKQWFSRIVQAVWNEYGKTPQAMMSLEESPAPSKAEALKAKARAKKAPAQGKALRETPSKRKYYQRTHGTQGTISVDEIPDAEPVTIPGLEDFEFVAHKTVENKTKWWRVTEVTTGMRVSDISKSRKLAIESATQVAAKVRKDLGVDGFRKRIEKIRAELGPLPGAEAEQATPAAAAKPPVQAQGPWVSKITAAHKAKDVAVLWEWLSNPGNKNSRRFFKELEPDAPAASAPIKAWRDYLETWSEGALEQQLGEKAKARAKEDADRESRAKVDADREIATVGPAWRRGEKVHDNALNFVRALLDDGFGIQEAGIGTVKFTKGDIFIGPFRNKHLNAAIRVVHAEGTPAAAEPPVMPQEARAAEMGQESGKPAKSSQGAAGAAEGGIGADAVDEMSPDDFAAFVDRVERGEDVAASEKVEDRTASQMVADAAKLGVEGVEEAFKGLSALFGGKKLGITGGINEDTFAEAKKHFDAAFEKFVAAGKSLREFVEFVLRQPLPGVKGYLLEWQRRRVDTKSNENTENRGTIKTEEKGADNAGERAIRESVPETSAGPSSEGTGRAESERATGGVARRRAGRVRQPAVATGTGSGSVEGGPGEGAGEPSPRGADGVADRAGGSDARTGGERGTGDRGSVAPRSNYRITDADRLGQGGWRQKARQNLDAIRLLRTLQSEGRPATDDEKAVLVKYVGWGASELANGIFPNPHTGEFKSDWKELGKELRELLSNEEYVAASRSTQNAHYTSEKVIRSIYRGLERMGFTGGRVLEPGCGVGHFIGLMPDAIHEQSRFTGVELDPVTAGIAQLLYPKADVRTVDFTKFSAPDGHFDLAVGNPPFARLRVLADRAYRKYAFSLHDYFFAKSIDKVRPGGLMVLVTSRYTMDKADDKLRQYLSERARLLGAVRLPQTAFKENAGTEVVTDVIFLQKRHPNEKGFPDRAWSELREIATDDGPAHVNEYYADHPEMVLGRFALQGSMYRSNELTVLPPVGDIEDAFATALNALPKDIFTARPVESGADSASEAVDLAPDHVKEGGFYLDAEGNVFQKYDGAAKSIRVQNRKEKIEGAPKRSLPVIKSYIPLRDAVRDVLDVQLREGSDEELQRAQAAMEKAYKAFVRKHGPINKAVVSTWEQQGQERMRVSHPNFAPFSEDPDACLVASIERYDQESGTATPGPIFRERVLGGKKHAEIRTAHDALGVVLNEKGRLDMAAVAERLGVSEEDAASALGQSVFMNPVTDAWETDDEYLSGNVRVKLEQAEAAAEKDGRFRRNVDALKAVQPEDLKPSQITMRLGMPIVPAEMVTEFARDVIGLPTVVVSHAAGAGVWSVTQRVDAHSVEAMYEWGTNRRNAVQLLEDALNSRTIRINDYVDNKPVFNAEATEAANMKLQKIRDRFSRWVWENPERAQMLAQKYNETYNVYRKRVFNGEHLTLEGVSRAIRPYAHQKAVAWRVVQSGNTYMAHQVGAGKTIASVISGMEMKRLGLIKKPMYVVPNHMLQQFSRELLELYPAAKIQVADEEHFHTSRRHRFLGQVAAENWDAVIITHSAFKLIPISPEFQQEHTQELLEEYKAMLADVADYATRKQLERTIQQFEQNIAALADQSNKHEGVYFEDTGIDFLFVDEAHNFRKLSFATNQTSIKGVDPNGSQRAWDLYIKTRYLEGKNPGHSLVLMSGTPITNTLGEMFTVMRYLQEPLLRSLNLHQFDAWATTFGSQVTRLEATPAGNYQPVTRFASFINVAQLSKMWSLVGDSVMTKELPYLKRPAVVTGRRQVVVGVETADQKEYKRQLSRRLKAIKDRKGPPAKGDDIILTVINDGRHAAIDPRFIKADAEAPADSKTEQLINNVFDIWEKGRSNRLTQMVFCDLGLPQAETARGFSVYTHIRASLIGRGVPKEEIAFMQDYKSSEKKQQLFNDMNAGKKRILLGSTQAMGEGVNAQERLVALHHLDAPWIPAAIEQREGRIVRQGNTNAEVYIFAYVTKGSYDETMWQILETKQRFIDQFLAGEATENEVEDLDGSEADQMALAKALSSDNPLILEQAGLRADIHRLQSLQQSHRDEQISLHQTLKWSRESVERLTKTRIPTLQKAIDAFPDLRGEKFAIEIGGRSYKKRAEAGAALFDVMGRMAEGKPPQDVGRVGGLRVRGQRIPFKQAVELDVVIGPDVKLTLLIADDDSPLGAVRRLENVLGELENRLREAEKSLEVAQHKIETAGRLVGQPFQHEEELKEKLARDKEITELLTRQDVVETGEGNENEEDGTIRLSRGRRIRGEGLSAERVQGIVERAAARWQNGPSHVRVVQSEGELPEQVIRSARRGGVRGAWDPWTDEVYLVADNIRSRDEALFVLAHEVVGHRGIEGVLGTAADGFYLDLAMKRYGVREYAKRKGLGFGTAAEKRAAAREWLADRVGAGDFEGQPWWRKLLDMLRRALARITGRANWSDAELRQLVETAVGRLNGEGERGQDGQGRTSPGAQGGATPFKGGPQTGDARMSFRRVEPPRPGQKGWGDGNESLRAEEARRQGLRTADEIAKAYGVPRDIVEGSLRWAEWHHVLKDGKKTPDMVHFYDFSPEINEDDALVLKDMEKQRGFRQSESSFKRRMTMSTKRHGLLFSIKNGMGSVTRKDGTRVAEVYGGSDNWYLIPSADAEQTLIWELEADTGLTPGTETRAAREYYARARSDAAERRGLRSANGYLYRGETLVGSEMRPLAPLTPTRDAAPDDVGLIEEINAEVGTYRMRTAKELLDEQTRTSTDDHGQETTDRGPRFSMTPATDADPPEMKGAVESAVAFVRNVRAAYRQKDINGKEDISQADLLLRTVAHYSEKVAAARKVYEAAVGLKTDKERFKSFVFDTPDGTSELRGFVKYVRKNREEARKLNEYLLERDRNAVRYRVKGEEEHGRTRTNADEHRQSIGGTFSLLDPSGKVVEVFDNEADAWEAAYRAEGVDLLKASYKDKDGKEHRFTPAAAEALVAFRRMTGRSYELLRREAEELMRVLDAEGIEMPRVTVKRSGETIELDLFAALAEMGDLRGCYFPRMRTGGRWMLMARKEGEQPVLEKFSTKALRAVAAAKYRGKGYTVQMAVSDAASQEAYVDAGIIAMNDLINNTLTRMKRSETPFTLTDFNMKGSWEKTKDGKKEFVVRGSGHERSRIRELMMTFGGQFYDAKREGVDDGKAWHFVEPAEDIEAQLAEGLVTALYGEQQPLVAFAQAFATQMAEMIHARGSRSAKIGRSEATGEDVWAGFEEDMVKAVTLSGSSMAGGSAKRLAARRMMAAMMGTDVSWREYLEENMEEDLEKDTPEYRVRKRELWDEYQAMVAEKRIDSSKQPNAYADTTAYIQDMLRNETETERVVGVVRGVAALKYLSGISTGLVNATALATTVPAAMKGYGDIALSKAPGLIARGMKEYGRHYLWHRFGKGEALDGDSKWLFDEITKRGWDEAPYNQEAVSALQSSVQRGWARATELAMTVFSTTERFNRAATIAGAYWGLREQGMEQEEALERAKYISDKAHGVYGKQNLPAWARGSHAGAQVLRSAYMFKTFSHNLLQVAYELGFKKRDRKAFAWMVLSPVVLAGPGALIGKDLIEALMKAVWGVFGEPPDDPEEAFYQWAEDVFGQPGRLASRTGAMGLLGIDISGSLGIELGVGAVPTKVSDLLGAPWSVVEDVYQGTGHLFRGEMLKGAEKLSPRVLGSPVKALREATQGITTGSNQPVFYGDEPLRAGYYEALLRSLGFNPSRLSTIRQEQWNEKLTAAQYSDERSAIYARARRLLVTRRPKAEWVELLADIERYNARVRRQRPAGVAEITDTTMKRLVTEVGRAPKRERG